MDAQTLEKINEFLINWEKSGLGRLTTIIAELAETGLKDLKEIEPTAVVAIAEDPLLTPAQAAKYLGISSKTLLNSWTTRYGIVSSGERKGRRFELSELNRVKELRKTQGAATNGNTV